MTRDFAVPPVIFPGANNVQQRRFPPSSSSSSAIPFMSFDIGSADPAGTMSSSFNNIRGSSSFEDEEPLLDELGIHPGQIWSKTRSILNPFRINQSVHRDSSDLSGPIFLYLALCIFQLLAGKIQFGVILGWIVVASGFLYAVFNMLAGRSGNLDLHTCTSLVGYCLLPVVVFSAVSLFVPLGVGVVRFVVAGVFVLWSTRACSGLVVSLADGGGEENRGLISYACFLIYCLFSLLVVF
ncbi:Protein YIP [Hirschfeldia incana]|nr:Protein YIP [Hirschfeldia incana]